MAQQNIDIIIEAKDKTEQAFESASSNTKKLGNVADGFKKVATVAFAAGSAAVVAFGAVAKTAIEGYIADQKDMALATSVLEKTVAGFSETQRMAYAETGKVADVMKEVSEAMNLAGQSALNLGYDDEVASVGFAKLFQVTGDSVQAQKDLALAMDLSAFSGQSLESSISAITKVHAGGTRVLKDFGIEVAEGTTALDALAVVQQKVGGTAETMSGTFSAQMQIMKNKFDNFKSGLGGSIMQAIFGTSSEQESATKFKEKMEEVFTFLEKNKETIAIVLVAPFKALYDIFNFLVEKLGDFKTKLEDIYTWLEDTGIIQFFKDIWENIATNFRDILVPQFQLLWEKLQPLMPLFDAMGKVFGVIILGAVLAVSKAIEGLIGLFTVVLALFTRIAAFLVDVFAKAFTAVSDAVQWVIDKVEKLISAIRSFIEVAKEAGIGSAIGKAVGKIFKVNDAVVNPNGNIISTHPDDYLIATKDPSSLGGGGTIVNINGGTYLSEDAARQLGDMIIGNLNLNMRGS